MDQILSYFGLVAELSVGIIAFQVIAVSFALTKKDHWNTLDNYRFNALITSFIAGLIMTIIPFFVEPFYLSKEPIIEFWRMVFSCMLVWFSIVLLYFVIMVAKLEKKVKNKVQGWGEYSPKLFSAIRTFLIALFLVMVFFFFIGFQDHIKYQIVCYSFPWITIALSFIPFSRLIIYSHD